MIDDVTSTTIAKEVFMSNQLSICLTWYYVSVNHFARYSM